jgi:hypothetical protein
VLDRFRPKTIVQDRSTPGELVFDRARLVVRALDGAGGAAATMAESLARQSDREKNDGPPSRATSSTHFVWTSRETSTRRPSDILDRMP